MPDPTQPRGKGTGPLKMTAKYRCEVCDRIGPMDAFQDECSPGWTHGRLIRVEEWDTYHEFAALEGAVEHLSRVETRTARRVMDYLLDRFVQQPIRDQERLEASGCRLRRALERLEQDGIGGRVV